MRSVSKGTRVALFASLLLVASAAQAAPGNDDGRWQRFIARAKAIVVHVLDEISIPKG